ncbi:MAG: alpha/beta hydrolase [Methermicoccaceae archaeon]
MIGKDKNVYYVRTSDGWKLAIKRYNPGRRDRARYPVVLCHGFAANRLSVDFGEEGDSEWDQYSLAGYLFNGGDRGDVRFDVWVPELRGRNGSMTFDPTVSPGKYNWCLDEYVDYDVPAIIRRVQRQYQKEEGKKVKVFWVGKSMGGMLAYAYGEKDGERRERSRHLKGVVTIASPVKFEHSKPVMSHVAEILLNIVVSDPVNLSEVFKQLKKNNERLFDAVVSFFCITLEDE